MNLVVSRFLGYSEERSRSKERYSSPRDKTNEWKIVEQPPEFWNQYKLDFAPRTYVRNCVQENPQKLRNALDSITGIIFKIGYSRGRNMSYSLEEMKIVIVGHVDYGKSTIISRLMADTRALHEGKLEQVQATCRRNSKSFKYAFLLEGLKEGHDLDQGITIDVAHYFFKSGKRDYVIMDSHGNVEFIKIMVTAPQAEAALLVIDAQEGIQLNSLRHGYLLRMLGVLQIIVLINKMDLVDFEESAYLEVVKSYFEFLQKIGIRPIAFIPVSGRFGDNISIASEQMPWYGGLTVLETLDQLQPKEGRDDQPMRLTVQEVYKFAKRRDQRRIIAGTIETGKIRVGDEVLFSPSGKRGRVHSLEVFPERPSMEAEAGYAIGFTLNEQIFVSRGELVTRVGELEPKVSSRLRVHLFWLGKNPLSPEKNYFIKIGTLETSVKLETILGVMDASTLDLEEKGRSVQMYQVAECIFRCKKNVAFDLGNEIIETGCFVIVDQYEIVGGGIIQESLEDYNLHWQRTSVLRSDREMLNGHRGGVIWFTGLSGSGKSTLANALEKRLFSIGVRTYFLDGDNIRQGLNQNLGFHKVDRMENIRRIAEVAKLFADAGVMVLAAFISPYEADRQIARTIIGDRDFYEIFVDCSLEECERRDTKGLYAKARRGEIQEFTGVSDPYEVPTNPELIISTEKENVGKAIERIIINLKQYGFLER